jgi:isochorismate pyruvate lyase
MLAKRREWAASEGLNPDAVEKLYTDLVNHFIEEEMARWKSHQAKV